MSDNPVEGAECLSRTLVGGSEEDFDTICDLCHSEGKRVDAIAYCVDCRENLCHECERYHKKTSATKYHILQDKLTMSTAHSGGGPDSRSSNIMDPLTDKCENHPEELIKFYCKSHKQLGCSICIPLHHRTCDDNVSYIRDISSDISAKEEWKRIQSDITKFVAALECCKSRVKWCQHETDVNYNQVVDEIKQFRQKINSILITLEEGLIKEASVLKQVLLEWHKDHTNQCDELIKDINEIKSDLEKKDELKHHNRLFIAMQSAAEKVPSLVEKASDIIQTVGARRLVFTPICSPDEFASEITSLGILSLLGKQEDFRAEYLHDINVKSDADEGDCLINGVVILPDGRLCVTDFNHKSVKLIDIADGTISEEVSLVTGPRGIAMTSDTQLAVLPFDDNYLKFLSLSPTLSVSHTVTMPGRYNGITFNAGKLILTCHQPNRSVHICDMTGNLLQQMDINNTGSSLFGARITVSPDQGTLYVSDFKNNNIVCLHKDGLVTEICVDDRFKCLEGIEVDDYGFVYVCSEDTHTVIQLNPSGKLANVLIGQDKGIEFPRAITHSDGKLYISSSSADSEKCNNIKVFKLSHVS